MPNLLLPPAPVYSLRRVQRYSKPSCKPDRFAARPKYVGRKFRPEIAVSTSNRTHRGTGEKAIYELLQQDLCYEPLIEPYALKVLYAGSRNGQAGWFVPDFYLPASEELETAEPGYNGIYIEISMGNDLTIKHHKIGFVAETYGKFVVHVTRTDLKRFLADPSLLDELLTAARHAQYDFAEEYGNVDIVELHSTMGTNLPPRRRIKAKPKGKRRLLPSNRKARNRPSRDPERRARRRKLRQEARELLKQSQCSLLTPHRMKRERAAQRSPLAFGVLPKKTRSKAPVPIKSKQYRQHSTQLERIPA